MRLTDEGNTIPFIARYSKEATGSLNDEVLRNLDERLKYLRGLEEQKEQVLSSIREQDKLRRSWKKRSITPSLWSPSTTCIVPTARTADAGHASQRKRGWSPWPTISCCR